MKFFSYESELYAEPEPLPNELPTTNYSKQRPRPRKVILRFFPESYESPVRGRSSDLLYRGLRLPSPQGPVAGRRYRF